MSEFQQLNLERASMELRHLISAENAEIVASGLGFGEGPVYDARADEVIFSDIVGDCRLTWSRRDGARVVAADVNKSNGLDLDADGALLACEHATSVLARWRHGTRTVIARSWRDQELNSPNDVAVSSDGAIWFTDPSYGRRSERLGIVRDQELDFQGVYRIRTSGELELVTDLVAQPNGLCFSPDGSRAYISDTERGELVLVHANPGRHAAEVDASGDVDGRAQWEVTVIASGIDPLDGESRVDGMTCDREGRIYVTGPGGLWVFDADGRHLGRVGFPGQHLTNVTWMDPELDVLFVTSRTSALILPMMTSGPGSLRREGECE